MSRLNAKAVASVLMLAIMVAAPAIMGLQAFTVKALSGVNVQLIPSKVVKGQDILFMVKQTSGAFTSGAPIYFEVSSSASWTGQGYYLTSLKPGTTTLPPGTLIYVPSTSGIYPSTTGTWWVLLSDSSDGSSGVAGAQFTVESGTPPVMSINGYTYTPSSQVSITYYQGTATAPSVTPTISDMPWMTPGETVTVEGALFRGSTVTVYFLYIYSNSWGDGFAMVPVPLATTSLSGGAFSVNVRIPDAPEGVHAILAVDDQGYYTFTFVYIYPTITVTPFSIAGQIGDTITVTGAGFPANAKIQSVKLYTTITNSPLGTTILSGGTVDDLGRVTFTARLDVPVPSNERGLLNLEVTYDPTAPGYDFQYDPDGNVGSDTFEYVLAASTPLYPGDEALILPEGLSEGTSTVSHNVGDWIKVVVVNFPAGARLDVYFGPLKVGTITTDSNGAGSTWIQVPELPGYDENSNQIQYYLRVKDPATNLMATGIPYSTTYNQWTVTITPEIYILYSGIGAGLDYVLPGTTITVVGYGLAPFDLVAISETITGVGTFNVLDYWWAYNTQVVEGYTVGDMVMTTSTGTFKVQYSVAYDILDPAPSTGRQVTVTADPTTTPVPPATSETYYEVAAPDLTVATLSDFGYPSGKPGDRITIQVGPGLVPSGSTPAEIVTYKLYFEGSPITMYDTATSAIVPYITVSSPTDTASVDIYVPNVPTGPKVISLRASYSTEDVAATWFIISNPQTASTGTARIMILPGYETVPSGVTKVWVVGWNFEVDESVSYPVYLGISGVGEGQINVDQNGAFLVDLVSTLGLSSLELPQDTYAVYVRRSAPAFAPVPTQTLTIVPDIYIVGYTGSVSIGTTVTLDAYGLDPNKVYMLRWSISPTEPGVFITDSSGAWLRFTTNGVGTKTGITFTVPFGLPYNYYYIQVVPADNPDTIIATFKVYLLPTTDFTIAGYRNYFVPLEKINIELANALSHLSTYTGTTLSMADVWNLILNGSVLVHFELIGGSLEATVPAAAVYDSSDVLMVSAEVPNFNATGVYGVSLRITNGTVDTGWIPVAGVVIGDTGGILVNIGGVMSDLAEIKTDLGTVLAKLSDLDARLVSVENGVATLQTTLGEVKADLTTLKDMLSDVNATLVAKGDEIEVLLNTTLGEITASLDALTELVNGGFAQVNENLVTIQTTLGEISMNISDLADLVAAAADAITLTVTDTADSIAALIMEKGDEVIANLTMQIEDLKPLIVSVNGTVMRLETILGEVNASVYELLGGQAEIKDLIVNKTGDVVNAIAVLDTRIGEVNATLLAALDMLKTGLVDAHRDIIDRLATLRTTLLTYNSQLVGKIDEAMQAISDVSSAVNAVSGKIDTLQQAVAGVADTVSSLSNDVNALSSKVDSVATTVNDISGKVVQIQSDVADVKTTASDIKNTVGTLPGKIDDVKSSVDNVGGKVDQVSSKLDNVSSQVSTVQSRTTVLNGITIVLVVITLILAAMGLRRPE